MREILETLVGHIDRALQALNEAESLARDFPESAPSGTFGTVERIAGLLLDAKLAAQLLARKC